ncbi:MAG: MBL fold metallo-hydrolase [Oligoflexales bacterium]
MKVKHLFDKTTCTLTYIVFDEISKDAVIIDPVLDYDPADGAVTKESITKLLNEVNDLGLRVWMILETHVHADHLSSSQLLKKKFPDAVLAIGKNICTVQNMFKSVFNLGNDFKTDGSQFDRLFSDGETVTAGSLQFQVLFTPGHTPACVSYLFDGAVFTGDVLFMPDYGTGRCDFPAGCAQSLYKSIYDILYQLPDATDVYVGHDYMPGGRDLAYKTTISEEKEKNIHLKKTTSESSFVEMRRNRDKTLHAPKLLFPSVQVNMSAGSFPDPEKNGSVYLVTPVKF